MQAMIKKYPGFHRAFRPLRNIILTQSPLRNSKFNGIALLKIQNFRDLQPNTLTNHFNETVDAM